MTEAAILEWAIDSIFEFGDQHRVWFSANDQPNEKINNIHHDVLNVSLVTLEQKNEHEGNLTSKLHVKANHSMFSKRVYCGNGITPQEDAHSIMIKERCKFFASGMY